MYWTRLIDHTSKLQDKIWVDQSKFFIVLLDDRANVVLYKMGHKSLTYFK